MGSGQCQQLHPLKSVQWQVLVSRQISGNRPHEVITCRLFLGRMCQHVTKVVEAQRPYAQLHIVKERGFQSRVGMHPTAAHNSTVAPFPCCMLPAVKRYHLQRCHESGRVWAHYEDLVVHNRGSSWWGATHAESSCERIRGNG